MNFINNIKFTKKLMLVLICMLLFHTWGNGNNNVISICELNDNTRLNAQNQYHNTMINFLPYLNKIIVPDKLSYKNREKRIICIDPGHQKNSDIKKEPIARDSTNVKIKGSVGAIGINSKVYEYELNLIVSKKLEVYLIKQGYEVVLTRDNNDSQISNVERAEFANDMEADIFIRIHADSSNNSKVNGVTVLVPSDKYISEKELLIKSRKLGQYLLDSIVKSTNANSRGIIEREDITGFNWCSVPMALIEMGFLSNSEEDLKLNSEEYQNKIILGIADAINLYFDSIE